MKGTFRPEPRPPRPAVVAFDVDGTLIRHYARAENGIGSVMYRGGWEPRDDSVAALKAFSAFPWVEVIVWSAGGRWWAQQVVDTLGINDLVDGVYGKEQYTDLHDVNPLDYPEPDIYFDDNGIAAWGKVWIHVDHNGRTGHTFWTPETYTEKNPCARCGFIGGCEGRHEADEQRQMQLGGWSDDDWYANH